MSKILKELCSTSKENFMCTETRENVFEMIRNALTKAPILVFPNFDKEFILDTDTIGEVLSKTDELGREHVVTCRLHAMNTHEKGYYCFTRKELLGIYYFYQHFNHYLY